MAKMFIAGESTGSSSGQTYDVINPATGEVVDSAPKGTESDARAAIDAAHAAFQAWSETAAEARAQLIVKGINDASADCADWRAAQPGRSAKGCSQCCHGARQRRW